MAKHKDGFNPIYNPTRNQLLTDGYGDFIECRKFIYCGKYCDKICYWCEMAFCVLHNSKVIDLCLNCYIGLKLNQ